MKPATPLPWKAVDGFVEGPKGQSIFSGLATRNTDEQNDQNAAYIVHAANSHGELVDMLRKMLSQCESMGRASHTSQILDEATALLLKCR